MKSDKDENTTKYEFTTCGAFTTYHWRSPYEKTERSNADSHQNLIENNFLLLVFYTFKTFISITDDLKSCVQLSTQLCELEKKTLVNFLSNLPFNKTT